MATTYTPLLQLALPTTGELSGTWGDVVNNNITSMIEQAVAGMATISTWTTNSHTLTVANGTTDEARCAMLVFTTGAGGTALTAAGTAICPATTKLYIAKNNAAYSVTLKTAAGTGVLVAPQQTLVLMCDGTNVTTAASSLSGAQTWLSSTISGTNIDLSISNFYQKTITANTTFTLSNVPPAGTAVEFYLELTNPGAYTTLFWSNVKWANNTAVTLPAYGTITLAFTTDDGGATWLARNVGTSAVPTYSPALNQNGNVYGGAGYTYFMVPMDSNATSVLAIGNDWSTSVGRTSLNKLLTNAGWEYGSALIDEAGTLAQTSLNNTNAAVVVGSTSVIVATGGQVFISGNTTYPTTWTRSTQLSSTSWSNAAVLSGAYLPTAIKFVIGGTSGKIAYSVDGGLSWTTTTSLSGSTFGTQTVQAIVANTGSSNYCAIGSAGGVGTSSDGNTWTYQAGLLTAWTSGVPVAAAYANGIIMVVGQSGKVATSADGVTWTNQPALAATAWGTNNPASQTALVYTGTAWVVNTANGITATSTDNGVTWTAYTTLQTAAGGTTPVAFTGIYGLCRGASGTVMAYGAVGFFAYSADNGATWALYEGPAQNRTTFFSSKVGSPQANINSVMWDGARFVAVGSGCCAATSPDGVNWVTRATGMRTNFAAAIGGATSARSVAYGGGIHMVGGDSSRIWTSADNGVTWTYLDTYRAIIGTTAVNGMAYGNSRFVGVGTAGRRLMTTDNGATWTTGVIWSASQANRVVFGNGVFVAGGASSHLATSSDGITWTDYQTTIQATAFGTKDIWGLCFGNGIFVAIGNSGVVVTSPDGVTWTYRSSLSSLGYGTSAIFYGATWTGTQFVAVGTTATSVQPIVATSPDGITWTDRSALVPSPPQIAYTNPVFYSVASNGVTTVIGGSSTSLVII